MIPKKIHYCWFGGNPLPELGQRCINSWKHYFPGYEIVEWNESNFDINCCAYVREAYEAKKWAFVSDFARFWIIYHEGGIYFDTDVEVIRPIDDLLDEGPFMACEHNLAERKNSVCVRVNPGLGLAAEAGHDIYKEMLRSYENRHFLNEDGSQNITTVVTYTTDLFMKYGFDSSLNQVQKILGISIYPTEYFCPLNYQSLELNVTNQTRTIHHYMASWQNKSVWGRIKKAIRRLIGPKMTQYILYYKNGLRKKHES